MTKEQRKRLAAIRAIAPLAMTADDELGMAWWNALTEQERAKWSKKAGNTGRASDAWQAFKRSREEHLPAVSRASHYS